MLMPRCAPYPNRMQLAIRCDLRCWRRRPLRINIISGRGEWRRLRRMCGGERSNWQARLTKFYKIPGARAEIGRNLGFIFETQSEQVASKLPANYFAFSSCESAPGFLASNLKSRSYKVGDGGNRFLNQCRMNGDSTRKKIRCAMFRHAERPNGSRRVPTSSEA